ncbi:MAG: sulfite exporter TauE/SafE family protein, partial [Halobacteriota archaeon]
FALGLLTLGYVLARQPWVTVPVRNWLEARCFRPSGVAKVALGFVSGIVFGATNIGVQIVAYLDALDLPRSIFVGVLALVLVGISTLRVGLAWGLGLYVLGPVLWVSILAIVPGLVGVALGRRVRWAIDERHLVPIVIVLLTLIGVRLLIAGTLGR